jgi:hypothetical protein
MAVPFLSIFQNECRPSAFRPSSFRHWLTVKHSSSNKGQVLASSPRAYAAQCPKSRSAALRLINPKRRCPFLHPALQPKKNKNKERIPSMWRFLILPDSLFTHKAPAQVPDPRPPPFFFTPPTCMTRGFFWRIHPLLFLVFSRFWVVAVRLSIHTRRLFGDWT